jgi:hypothetical protein
MSLTNRLEKSLYFSYDSDVIEKFELTSGKNENEWLCTKTGTYYIKIVIYESLTTHNGRPGVYSLIVLTQ